MKTREQHMYEMEVRCSQPCKCDPSPGYNIESDDVRPHASKKYPYLAKFCTKCRRKLGPYGEGAATRWGIVFRPLSLWVGVHYSPYNKRFCINLVPCVTLWITLPGGNTPFDQKCS